MVPCHSHRVRGETCISDCSVGRNHIHLLSSPWIPSVTRWWVVFQSLLEYFLWWKSYSFMRQPFYTYLVLTANGVFYPSISKSLDIIQPLKLMDSFHSFPAAGCPLASLFQVKIPSSICAPHVNTLPSSRLLCVIRTWCSVHQHLACRRAALGGWGESQVNMQ